MDSEKLFSVQSLCLCVTTHENLVGTRRLCQAAFGSNWLTGVWRAVKRAVII